MNWKTFATLLTPALLALLSLPATGDDKKPDENKAGEIIILDAKGKENKLKNWQIVAGTRRLGWLAQDDKDRPNDKEKPADKDEPAAPPRKPPLRPAPRGPEALVVRDDNSTAY